MNYFILTKRELVSNRTAYLASIYIIENLNVVNREKFRASVTSELKRTGIFADEKLSFAHLDVNVPLLFSVVDDTLTISEFEAINED